ncbi:MAG TPA: cytochrome c [Opitutaceae bacterium]|nr:cytochrome c [Opitutaceae bacterium]
MPRFLRFAVYALVGLVVLVGVIGVVVYAVSGSKLGKLYPVAVRPVAIPTDAAAVARGQHIAQTRGCMECHGKDLGGAMVIDDGAMGRMYAPNLTKGAGSRTAAFKDEDWVRAIRHGVRPDGHGLFLMPSDEYSHFSDEDLGAVIAFVKTVPPVARDRVEIKLGPVSRVLVAIGKMKLAAETIDHANLKPPSVMPGITAEYGKYLAAGCTGCHGSNYSGGKIEIGPPDWPPAANLTPHSDGHLSKWSEADFVATLRTARRPDGTELNPVMPRAFGQMNDTELKALFAFLKTLPPTATGAR